MKIKIMKIKTNKKPVSQIRVVSRVLKGSDIYK